MLVIVKNQELGTFLPIDSSNTLLVCGGKRELAWPHDDHECFIIRESLQTIAKTLGLGVFRRVSQFSTNLLMELRLCIGSAVQVQYGFCGISTTTPYKQDSSQHQDNNSHIGLPLWRGYSLYAFCQGVA